MPYPFHLVSAFSFSVTPFRFASSGTISSMRFRAASSILAQYCLTYTQLSGTFLFGAEKGIRPAALGQCRRQPGELKKRPPDAFLPRCAPPFPSNPFLFHYINKKSTLLGTFLFGAEKGIRTLVTVPRKHDFQSCAFDQLSHLCKPLKYNTTFLCALQAESYIADKNSVT